MKLSLTLAALVLAGSVSAQSNWKLDASHSNVTFTVTHLVVSEVDGRFTSFDSKLVADVNDFSTARVETAIKSASVNTDNTKRDEHLRSDDFFNAEQFPEIKFVSTSFKKVGENKYKVIGNLTIRDVTKQVELDVKFNGTIKDPWGNNKVAFKATGEINRFDFNLKWNKLIETGGAVVGETVGITINAAYVEEKKS